MTDLGETWVRFPDGQSLGAVFNAEGGCLFYRRTAADAGLTSRNPNTSDGPDAWREYVLSDGSRVRYPATWALPVKEVVGALAYFRQWKRPPDFISWQDEAGDPVVLDRAGRPRAQRGDSSVGTSKTARFLAALWIFCCGAAGAFLGGCQAFQLLLPAESPDEEYVCGLSALPAMFLGFPAGLVVGGLLGIGLGKLTLAGASRLVARRRAFRERGPDKPAADLWDRRLDA